RRWPRARRRQAGVTADRMLRGAQLAATPAGSSAPADSLPADERTVRVTVDLVVRGGTVIDGTGAPGRVADVAIDDGVIVEVGRVAESGRREVGGDGAIVTPGFVDIHTHYDGQATW